MQYAVKTPQGMKRPPRFGKDELNLADWRIGVPTHQQPQGKDGGKVDFVEYEIERQNEPNQIVTIEAPRRKGLPTPSDEDVLIGLLALAKQQGFKSDMVHFVPRHLLQTIRWPLKQDSYDRLELALKRLTAVTITYELTWYNKLTAEVEPILVTGILAESKLVRRRGRKPAGSIPDSYVQWTNDFYRSIEGGNLTDLDLELYFSFKRPCTKHLYRHLNKRFYGPRSGKPYERDMKHLACGHLGMTDSKDLKRNFHFAIAELEDNGYLPKLDPKHRYRKVRKGVWRVRFDPPADRTVQPIAARTEAEEADFLPMVFRGGETYSARQTGSDTDSRLYWTGCTRQ